MSQFGVSIQERTVNFSRCLILLLAISFSGELLSMAKYDDADYHFSEKVLEEKGEEFSIRQSYVHGGMYLKWAVDNNLVGGSLTEFNLTYTEKLKTREIKGSELLKREDGVIDSGMFTDEGQMFTEWYFGAEKDSYFEDYEKALAKDLSDYLFVEDTWENFDLISKVISERYQQWKNANQSKQ